MADSITRRLFNVARRNNHLSVLATAVIDECGILHTLNDNTNHPELVDHLLHTGKLRYRSQVSERGFLLSDGSFCSRKKAAVLVGKPSGSLCYSTDIRK